MYKLPYFRDQHEEAVLPFIRNYPFAFITGTGKDGKPVATQIPLFADEKQGRLYLSGHLMRNTDHHHAFDENPEVLVVFTGPHCYVSATWYSDPHQASTWNYMSVHCRGNIRFLDHAALEDMLQRTTLHFENGNEDATTVYKNLSRSYTEKLIKAIVAFEIEVTEMDHVFKLSQNRDEESYENIIQQLKKEGGDAAKIAEEMEARKESLYSR